jgi:predicted ATPase/class 3 adenylate cyclase
MPPKALERLQALLERRTGAPTAAAAPTLVWLALKALEHPELAPYLADPLLPCAGEFLSLDSQQWALQNAAVGLLDKNIPCLGMLWGALYRPAEQKAVACRVAVAALPVENLATTGWPDPEPILLVSADVRQSAEAALTEALRLIEQVGLPPPRPVRLLYAVEQAEEAVGDSLGLPLFLAMLSALTERPLNPAWGATGALLKGTLKSVGWIGAKAESLAAHDVTLLCPENVSTLAEAAAKALLQGDVFTQPTRTQTYPLVSEPTFLAADTELPDPLGARAGIAAFEQTVCAALERHGGFLYRQQAGVEEGVRAAFATPQEACAAAVAVQQALLYRLWPEGTVPLRARIGIFKGSAERVQEGYFGVAPGQALRLMQAAQPGQILLPEELVSFTPAPVMPLGKHRLRDLSMTLTLYRLDAPGVPLCDLPPRTLRVRNHNLPLEPSPLLGREADLAAIRGLLESGKRLVTLTGPGGVGKTRLALQVAAELAERYPDGVWFVPLAEVQEEGGLVHAIAEAMGLAIRDSRVNFIEALAERRALLVLDNFETALAAASRVAQLLRQAPELTCLVTSQALLSLSGEWRFEVPPLVLAEAERLFIERALQAEPGLSLSEADMACIGRICQRLEGMPLAVELAAARRRLFSLEEIESRLDDALSLLITRTRDVPERQRTLRRALEWSFSLLDQEEQGHFLRLCVLPGSFNLEAARAVCEEPEIGEWLLALEEKSLLRKESNDRWRMLSIVRIFAQERLHQATAEQEAAQEGLLTYCIDLSCRCAEHLDTEKEQVIFTILDTDFDLIRASMELMYYQTPQRFAEYLLNLDFFLRRRRYLSELEHWCDLVLERAEQLSLSLKGRLLIVKSYLLRERERNEESIEILKEVESISKQIKDDFMYADSISSQGIILVRKKEYDKAIAFYDTAIEIYINNNNLVRYVRTLNSRAQAKIRQQKFSEAEKDLIQANEIGEKIHCTRDLCVTMNNLGYLFYTCGDYDKEIFYTEKCIELLLGVDDKLSFIAAIMNYWNNRSRVFKINIRVFIIGDIIYNRVGIPKILYDNHALIKSISERDGITNVNEIYDEYRDTDFSDLKMIKRMLDELAYKV